MLLSVYICMEEWDVVHMGLKNQEELENPQRRKEENIIFKH